MFILHVDLTAKPGRFSALETIFRGVFCPAITRQPGFTETRLLLAKFPDENRSHRLVIAFEKEECQREWVRTSLHKQVSEELNDNIKAVYSTEYFDLV
jgi:heme-degrading monooxygenase HmoA